jgi:WD40 repeat protein
MLFWDMKRRKPFSRMMPEAGLGNSFRAVTISPDGSYALSGDRIGTIQLWEIATGKLIRTFLVKGVREHVYALAFSPDGKLALVGMGGQRVKLLDVKMGREIRNLVTTYDLRKTGDVPR